MSKFKKIVAVMMCAIMLTGSIAGCMSKKYEYYDNTPVPDFISVTGLDEDSNLDYESTEFGEQMNDAVTMLSLFFGENETANSYTGVTMDDYMSYVKVLFNEDFEAIDVGEPDFAVYAKNDKNGVFLVIVTIGEIETYHGLSLLVFHPVAEKMDSEEFEAFIDGYSSVL